MLIKYLLHHQIDKQAWDDCIDRAPNGLVYALSWYLDTVTPGWEAIVAVEHSAYQMVFPLPVRQRWGQKYIFHPLFCQQLGLFFQKTPDKALADKMIQTLLTYYAYIPRLFFNIEQPWPLPEHARLRVQQHYTHLLYLNRPYSELYRNYRRDRRYRLKQAQRNGIRMVASEDIEPLIAIFLKDTLHKVPGAHHNPTHNTLREVFNAVRQYGRYELYYTQDQRGRYTSGGWFVIYNYYIIYLFNAALDTARHENGRTLILDHMIRKYQNSRYVLDFESPEKEAIYDFYASFGSQPTPFYDIYFNNLPRWVRQLHRVKIRAHRKLLRLQDPHRPLPDIVLPE